MALSQVELVEGLSALIGAPHVLTDPDAMAPYLKEWRGLFPGKARCVVRPAHTQEVASVLQFCHTHRIPLVPQGGNTGLVGGQTPWQSGDEIVLSLQRLHRIRDVDPLSDTMVCEAGVTLLAAQEAAEQVDRLFPLSLASEGSCTIGGNLSSNAGGTAVLAYGNARELTLGLEVVLADGRVMDLLGRLRKDNTGYDLKNLFIGAEGTLGIITAAVLKLFPRPRAQATTICGMASPQAALQLLAAMKDRFGNGVTTFELLPAIAMDMVCDHIPGNRNPLTGRHAWYVLLEISGADDGLNERVETALAEAIDRSIIDDAALATSLDQRMAFWRLRETLPEAQGFEGGSIKHDIAVPLASVPSLIDAVCARVQVLVPGARPVPFGHLGDGNLHFNITQPKGMDRAAFMALWDDVGAIVYDETVKLRGSISAEHGIGRLKKSLLREVKDPVALSLMSDLKRILDPLNILNPGKVIDLS
ncbi:MAG: FAD-binding oxidoreductase [Beijerinckiaceae bacterium]|nr:FAD-binding oxidoreductase [Beijerinckiaceae bacterium]